MLDNQEARRVQDYKLESDYPYNCKKCGKGFKKEAQRDRHETKDGAHLSLLDQWEFRKEVEKNE